MAEKDGDVAAFAALFTDDAVYDSAQFTPATAPTQR